MDGMAGIPVIQNRARDWGQCIGQEQQEQSEGLLGLGCLARLTQGLAGAENERGEVG